MPVLPDFGSFAATPNLGGNYLEGVQVAQQAQQHAQSLQLQREKLAQDAQQAQMEFQAKQAQFEQQQLRYEHQMAIDKAYKDATIGWHQRQIEDQEKRLALATAAAAQKLQVQQQYQNRLSSYTDPEYMAMAGEEALSPEEASRRAILELNPALFGGAGTAAMKPGGGGIEDFGPATDVPGLPSEYKQKQVGPQQVRIIHLPQNLAGQPAQQAEGLPDNYKLFGGKLVRLPDPAIPIRSEIKALRKELENDPGLGAANKKARGEKLTPTQELQFEHYKEKKDHLKKLEDQLEALSTPRTGSPTNSPAAYIPSGLTGGTTNQVGRFRIITR